MKVEQLKFPFYKPNAKKGQIIVTDKGERFRVVDEVGIEAYECVRADLPDPHGITYFIFKKDISEVLDREEV